MNAPTGGGAPAGARPMPERRARELVKTIVREPLVHFLLLGVLIFGVAALWSARREDAARRIVVDQALVRHLAARYEAQLGAAPSKAQLASLIDDYVREEVRVREAKRLGLDQDDEIVRRRLASKYDFLQSDLARPREPTPAKLAQYYERHRQEFAEPAAVTFTHVYFSPDRDGEAAARARAASALAALAATNVTRAPERGDPFPLQSDYASAGRLEVVQQFGDNELVVTLFTGPVGRWLGPVRSGYGWHLVYVSERDDSRIPPLDAIRERVTTAYLDAAREQAVRERDAALERRYVIVRPDRP
jgi:parvulin-like peptidyl-prolyl isomerase